MVDRTTDVAAASAALLDLEDPVSESNGNRFRLLMGAILGTLRTKPLQPSAQGLSSAF